MTIGEKIEKHRKQLNLSQEELGNVLFVSRQTISQWENDQTSPTIDNFLRLCDVFGISMNDFFDYKVSNVDNTSEYQEEYSWKYSEEELNTFYSVIRKKDIIVFALTRIFELFIGIIAFVLKAKIGFTLCFLFLTMGIVNFTINQITYRRNCKQATVGILGRQYVVSVDDNSILITAFDENGKTLFVQRIQPIYIEKTWDTANLKIIQYEGRRYIIKKNELPKESQLRRLLGI
jgi:transcriptional regulator with XRE-family HTH domain